MATINGFYAISTSSGVQEYSANKNVKVYITLDLTSKSVTNNTATLNVNVYFQHNTINVPVTNSSQSGYITLNGVQTNFTWNPSNYARNIGGTLAIPTGTLVRLYSGNLTVDYGSQTSDLTFNVVYYGNLNPGGAFRYIRGSGNMTISKITNGHIKYNRTWKNAFCWLKRNGSWTRCLIWKKIDGEWKKGI